MKKPQDPSAIVSLIASRLETHPTHPLSLTDDQKSAMIRAFSSRGRRRGYLLGRAPSAESDPLAYAAWVGMQPNAYKVSVGGAILLRDAAAREFLAVLSRYRFPGCLDYDRDQLERLGAW